jgi:hypothetical protein
VYILIIEEELNKMISRIELKARAKEIAFKNKLKINISILT